MSQIVARCTLAVAIFTLATGCTQQDTAPASLTAAPERVIEVEAGEDAPQRLQEVLIEAKSGDIIQLGAGTFSFTSTLSLFDKDQITIRGKGPQETILTFKDQQQGTGGEGVLINNCGVVLADLAIEDTKGDALKITKSENIIVRSVRTEWTGEASEKNGAYGIYPVECKGVLVEDCIAIGASDAGIYVGQSQNVVVRRNRVHKNVAGIEIENCLNSDVYENVATENTGGILVFSLPNLPAGNGRVCRVFNNQVSGNNHPNFAPEGAIVASVPPGTGIMVMAFEAVEIFENTIENNQTANLSILSYLATSRKYDDPNYDPYTEAVHVHHNTFTGGGESPSGRIGELVAPLVGGTFPDIVYDGIVDTGKLVDGQLPSELQIVIHDNGDADFINLDLANFDPVNLKLPKFDRDIERHAGSHAALPAVDIAWVK